MNYGLYISATGATNAMYRQDVLGGNLANLDTVGFKPVIASARLRDAARVEDSLWNLPSNEMLERLGAGVHAAPNRVSFKQGPIETTGNPFDLAIRGDGFFLVRGQGESTSEQLRLSRDGRLTQNDEGTLVRTADGLPVLDPNGREIRLPEAQRIVIQSDGRILADGEVAARIGLIDVRDRSALTPEGHGLMRPTAEAFSNRIPATGVIDQFAVEGSAVNEIETLMQLTSAARAAQGNLRMISMHDQLMDRAINRLGRIS